MTRVVFSLLTASAFAALIYLGGGPVHGQSLTDVQRGEIERVIKDYLLAHPELIAQVLAELEKRQNEAEAVKHREGVKQHSKALLFSPRQVTLGNPSGDVTMVEFFDYNCGYCRRALTDMLSLMNDDPKLRVVLKEFPVLGPGSVESAQVAVAVARQDKDGMR